MYQIGIYDDEPVFLKHAASLLTRILSAHSIPCHVHTFQTSRELSAFLSSSSREYPPPGKKARPAFAGHSAGG